MPDVFISYSNQDEAFANFLYKHLTQEGLDVFLASVSIEPGQTWTDQIFENLKRAPWVLFLASKAASSSQYVQQELGAAFAQRKKVVPIIWDMEPSELPGWSDRLQALNLAGASFEQVRHQIGKIADRIKADKRGGYIIGGLLVAGFIYLVIKD